MDLGAITALINADLTAVDTVLQQSLTSQVAMVNQIAEHLANSGGKRIRPQVVLLCSHACKAPAASMHAMAAAVELIHTATLLHDDVVDNAKLRRGKTTAHHLWGNQATVLSGDFLYSRAFQIMVQVGNLEILRIMANATKTIAEGEVLQLVHQQRDPLTLTETDYYAVIQHKTAQLFEAAAEVSAVLGDSSYELQQVCATYGMQLGLAFQLIDDLLDYQPVNDKVGKNCGNDLQEGKITLPLIHLLANCNEATRSLVERAIKSPTEALFNDLCQAMQNYNSLAYTHQAAQKAALEAQQAIAELPDSPYRQAAIDLAQFAVQRSY